LKTLEMDMAAAPTHRYPITTRHLVKAGQSESLSFIRPESIDMGVNDVHGKFDFHPHVHPHYEIIIVDRGRYSCDLNGVLLNMRPGEILVIKPGDTHADHVRRPLRYFGIHFRLPPERDGQSQSLFVTDIRPQQQIFRAERRVFWGLINRFQQEAARQDHVSSHMTEALLQELFWSLIRALPVDVLSPKFKKDSAREAFLARLKTAFARRRRQAFCLAEVAQALDLSASTLSRRCRHILGLAPAQAFMRFRMDWARQMLMQTTLSIKEISAELGFENQFHFSRVFKKVHGVPPSRVNRLM
jgi:AraC-like DNA-binding protein/mannose-6-phosphate isomerase-like protein (cupin superfamily)